MRPLARYAGVAVFALVGLAVTQRAVADRKRVVAARSEIAQLQASLDALRPVGRTSFHVAMNGVLSAVSFDAEAPRCEDGPTSLGAGDDHGPRFVREAERREEAADGTLAVLCVLRNPDTGERRERLSLVRPKGATSITREAGNADLATMFPRAGDAPGDDLSGVPRPAGAQRVLAATVLETGHAVRAYEVEGRAGLELEREVLRTMHAAGFTRAVEGGDGAWLFLRGSERIVVSIETTGDGARVTFARAALL